MLHFIHNTAHLPGSAHGILLEAGSYSGVVVDNNIFNYLGYAGGRTILEFTGKGKGTKLNLNCVSSAFGFSGTTLARKAATHTLQDLQLSFRSLDLADENPGASLRGSCFDIYSQEKLFVLRKP
ncbi:MAG: hypothetical protein M3Y08_05280 [Fibrobacterota bacterium]|nr:hypothetical protein [Fibrobacterota bacterium]